MNKVNNKNIPRLFINKELKFENNIILEKNDKHYLKNVLRLSQDKIVHVFNGVNGEWEALVNVNNSYSLICKKQIRKQIREEGPKLYFAIIKNHNLRWMIEKVTELGVEKITPIVTQRTNNKTFSEKKVFLHIKEASEVSERLTLPKLEKKNTLLNILKQTKQNSDTLFFCNEGREDDFLQKSLINLNRKKVSFLIGPEGGFTQEEEKLIKSYSHVRSVKLFDRILRAETAAVLAMSIFNSYTEKKI